VKSIRFGDQFPGGGRVKTDNSLLNSLSNEVLNSRIVQRGRRFRSLCRIGLRVRRDFRRKFQSAGKEAD
jgi:hypothetical protein